MLLFTYQKVSNAILKEFPDYQILENSKTGKSDSFINFLIFKIEPGFPRLGSFEIEYRSIVNFK